MKISIALLFFVLGISACVGFGGTTTTTTVESTATTSAVTTTLPPTTTTAASTAAEPTTTTLPPTTTSSATTTTIPVGYIGASCGQDVSANAGEKFYIGNAFIWVQSVDTNTNVTTFRFSRDGFNFVSKDIKQGDFNYGSGLVTKVVGNSVKPSTSGVYPATATLKFFVKCPITCGSDEINVPAYNVPTFDNTINYNNKNVIQLTYGGGSDVAVIIISDADSSRGTISSYGNNQPIAGLSFALPEISNRIKTRVLC